MKKKYKIYMDETYCKGCGICVAMCPMDVYEQNDRISDKGYLLVDIVHPEKCIGCGNCELYCPDHVILIEEEEAEDDS